MNRAPRRGGRAVKKRLLKAFSRGLATVGLWVPQHQVVTQRFQRAFPHGLGSLKTLVPRNPQLLPLRRFPARHPVIFGATVAMLKTGFTDWCVQKFIEGKEVINWRRVGGFSLFGLVYLGCVQYFIYVPLFTKVVFPRAQYFLAKPLSQRLKDFRGIRDAVLQVLLDFFPHGPLIYYPSFYLCQQFVLTGGAEGWAHEAMQRWRRNLAGDMTEYFKVWVPAMTASFVLLPGYMRIPFVATVSVLWTSILSLMHGDPAKEEAKLLEKEVPAAATANANANGPTRSAPVTTVSVVA